MEMDDYKPNSYAYKEAQKKSDISEKKIEPIVTGKIKKKSEARRFADSFLSEDISSVRQYVISDVLIPAIKKAISDIVTEGIDILLYGESGRSKKSSATSKVSYSKFYDKDDRRGPQPVRSAVFDYDTISFNSRGDAEAVISALEDIIDRYGVASVGDFYDLAQVSTTNYSANKYGWTDIRTAEPVRCRDGGYIIKMPRAMPID